MSLTICFEFTNGSKINLPATKNTTVYELIDCFFKKVGLLNPNSQRQIHFLYGYHRLKMFINEEPNNKKIGDVVFNKNPKIVVVDLGVSLEELRKHEELEKVLERQKKLRKEENKNEIKTQNKILNETLEDMCIFGTIMKEKITAEKEKNPEKFIEIKEATKEENKENGIFCLGLLAQNLEQIGITTAIEKDNSDSNNQIEQQDAADTALQFIMSGLIDKKNIVFILILVKIKMKNYYLILKNKKNLMIN